MHTYIVIWYDLESEKLREEIEAKSEEEAIQIATRIHHGKKPAELVSATRKDVS